MSTIQRRRNHDLLLRVLSQIQLPDGHSWADYPFQVAMMTPPSEWPEWLVTGHWTWVGATVPRRDSGPVQRICRTRDLVPYQTIVKQAPRAVLHSLRHFGDSRLIYVHNFIWKLVFPLKWDDRTALRKLREICTDTLCLNPLHWEPVERVRKHRLGVRPDVKLPGAPTHPEAQVVFDDIADLRDMIDELVGRKGAALTSLDDLVEHFVDYTLQEIVQACERDEYLKKRFLGG